MHWIERHIIVTLTRQKTARAKDLQPQGVEGNLVAHYLGRLLRTNIVERESRGVYSLTNDGERLAGTFSTLTSRQAENIKSCVLLYAKNKDGKYLLFRWSRQPYYGKLGFLVDRMAFGDDLGEALEKAMKEKVGQVVSSSYVSQGFIKIKREDSLISHMHVIAYELELGETDLPFVSRNGCAQFVALDDKDVMTGLPQLVELLDAKVQLFDAALSY